MELDTQHFKEMLETEEMVLEGLLADVGRKSSEHAGDWEVSPTKDDADRADETEVADSLENMNDRNTVLNQDETRMREVKEALDKIQQGTYGICEECEEQIEMDRLEANPAASTCKLHMNG